MTSPISRDGRALESGSAAAHQFITQSTLNDPKLAAQIEANAKLDKILDQLRKNGDSGGDPEDALDQ